MSADRKLATTVHLDGTVYDAGASVPAEVAEQITNPKAWGESEPEPQGAGKSEPKAKSKGKEKSEPKQTPPPVEPTGDDELTVPPLVGAGSSGDAWKTYAVAAVAKAGLNIEFPEDAKRGDIIAALDEAGIATKPKE